MKKPKLSLTDEDYQEIISLVANKFAFDEMFLKAVTTKEDITVIKGRLNEADLLFKKLETHPDYLTESTAKWVVAFLMDAQTAYQSAIKILHDLGYVDVSELKEELKKAEQLHEKLNEFLIDCIDEC